VVFDPEAKGEYAPELRNEANGKPLGISSLAATCLELLGFKAPADYDPSVLAFKK
jgi:2,3-bisphosphoglycerate-independent phosphoglycerate mutase